MQQRIRFHFDGRIVAVDDQPITRTVLEWLRASARRTGTKEGCAEGDCGACTVIVAERAGPDAQPATASSGIRAGGLILRPINACIRFLPTLHGKALLTVEDLRTLTSAPLHPVQQAMVDCHASQCGFCTPGIVMSLFAMYENHMNAGTRPVRSAIADGLAGNLCRCTGYRPILHAGERMFTLPPALLDTAPIEAALDRIAAETPDVFVYTAAASPAIDGAPPRIDRFSAPRTIDALADLYARQPASRLLAGATDIGLWVNKQFRDLGDLLYLGEVAELRTIAHDGFTLRIGAAVPLEDAWVALAALVPDFAEMAVRFAGPPVRHAGTMGGNVANGSPIGDSAPVLLALDARLILQHGDRTRSIDLGKFYLDYMRNDLAPGEFLRAIEIPAPSATTAFRAYKLSKRFDCDISALSCGLAVSLDGGIVRHIRIAFGGMAATVRRAPNAEAMVQGAPWSEDTVRAAMAALEQEFAPLSDLRASSAYRMRTACNLLWRFWLETRPERALPPSATRVRRFTLAGAA